MLGLYITFEQDEKTIITNNSIEVRIKSFDFFIPNDFSRKIQNYDSTIKKNLNQYSNKQDYVVFYIG